jgi:hypothetical protein
MTLSGTAEPAPAVPEGLIREEVAAPKLTELQGLQSES